MFKDLKKNSNKLLRYVLMTLSVIGVLTNSASSADTKVADVNVLIIGSEKDTSEISSIGGDSQGFSPAEIKTELEKILKGSKLGTVNIVLEDRHRKGPSKAAYNLVSWFFWPYPAEVEAETRWPNLRGQKGTKWDYVVLIGDPYTIEKMPGLYTQGVAKVAEQVSMGTAETILLMPWPADKSSSSVAHYTEVVYRTGRSGGFKVAPAALAWEAAGKPAGNTHPSKDGAYIAAASLYSRIWNKSAKTSSYSYKDKLADIVYKTVSDNVGKKQYTGKFEFQSPFKMFGDKSRSVSTGKSGGGTSTEDDYIKKNIAAITRAGAWQVRRGSRYINGRFTDNPKGRKDFRNKSGRSFGYVFQSDGGTADLTVSNIVGWEMYLANKMIAESKDYRIIPRRILVGELLQYDPDMRLIYGGHTYGPQSTAVGTYMYTLFSGRCPVDPKPETMTPLWDAQKVGYEMAWRVSHCQSRAPGFKVLPSSAHRLRIDGGLTEEMTVQFILPPQKNVTVKVSSSAPNVASVSTQLLTFTPENYNQPQKVVVTTKKGSSPGTPFTVLFDTLSKDEVYNELHDSWKYTINRLPIFKTPATAVSNLIEMPIRTSTFVRVIASDPDGDALAYTWSKVSGPGDVTFQTNGNGSSDSTCASFTKAGSYVLRASILDGPGPGLGVFSDVTVKVTGTHAVNSNAGLWVGNIPGKDIDTSSENPKSKLIRQLSRFDEIKLGKKTEVLTGQIFDADGNISLSSNVGGKVRITIDGKLVLNDDHKRRGQSTKNLKLKPGWHDIEIRFYRKKVGRQSAIYFDRAGGTSWKLLFDPGDASLLRGKSDK